MMAPACRACPESLEINGVIAVVRGVKAFQKHCKFRGIGELQIYFCTSNELRLLYYYACSNEEMCSLYVIGMAYAVNNLC